MQHLQRCVFSVDVEDWFHIMDLPHAPRLSEWDSLPSHVERNFHKILDLLNERGTKATFFFLGWVAERYPNLVRDAVATGHEIASHGYAHDLIYEITPSVFRDDVLKARLLLEDIAGCAVKGYRAPGFSVTKDTPWFFEELASTGYVYSSSVFPAMRGHGGVIGFKRTPHSVATPSGNIFEFPISVANVLGRPMCFFGGGYLRLFPYPIIEAMSKKVLNSGLPVIYYIHPREIEPNHPRLPMSLGRAFKSYVGLDTVIPKIRKILAAFSFVSFDELYKVYAGR